MSLYIHLVHEIPPNCVSNEFTSGNFDCLPKEHQEKIELN